MCVLQCIPALRHRFVELYASLKNVDNIAIFLIVTLLIFQFGKFTDRWTVVCLRLFFV